MNSSTFTSSKAYYFNKRKVYIYKISDKISSINNKNQKDNKKDEEDKKKDGKDKKEDEKYNKKDENDFEFLIYKKRGKECPLEKKLNILCRKKLLIKVQSYERYLDLKKVNKFKDKYGLSQENYNFNNTI